MQDWPIWTLEDAQATLPQVIDLTRQAMRELKHLESQWRGLPIRPFDAVRGAPRETLVRADWARQIASLGIQPKGYFVVDFQSLDPDIVLCWSYGETRITHEHKVWETFADRRLIGDTHHFQSSKDEPSTEPPASRETPPDHV